jgi:hypothetical protein
MKTYGHLDELQNLARLSRLPFTCARVLCVVGHGWSNSRC